MKHTSPEKARVGTQVRVSNAVGRHRKPRNIRLSPHEGDVIGGVENNPSGVSDWYRHSIWKVAGEERYIEMSHMNGRCAMQ
jgi:hypothetical protein